MPNYYNTYGYPNYNPYSVGQISFQPYPQQSSIIQMPQNSQYMINVDGEMAARAWQMPANLPPNTIIPLYDLDGQHVYFKSVDSYGRMNPLRKGRIVFDDEQQNLPQGQSGAIEPVEKVDMSNYVTKEDFDDLKDELKNMMATSIHPIQNQNGSRNNNRGENR